MLPRAFNESGQSFRNEADQRRANHSTQKLSRPHLLGGGRSQFGERTRTTLGRGGEAVACLRGIESLDRTDSHAEQRPPDEREPREEERDTLKSRGLGASGVEGPARGSIAVQLGVHGGNSRRSSRLQPMNLGPHRSGWRKDGGHSHKGKVNAAPSRTRNTDGFASVKLRSDERESRSSAPPRCGASAVPEAGGGRGMVHDRAVAGASRLIGRVRSSGGRVARERHRSATP
jgi:hypothetical protein